MTDQNRIKLQQRQHQLHALMAEVPSASTRARTPTCHISLKPSLLNVESVGTPTPHSSQILASKRGKQLLATDFAVLAWVSSWHILHIGLECKHFSGFFINMFSMFMFLSL